MAYDYKKAVRNDLYDYIKDQMKYYLVDDRNDQDFRSITDPRFSDYLQEGIQDDVSGSRYGSHTNDNDLAKEYVTDNMNIAKDAYVYHGEDLDEDINDNNWEKIDSLIRDYLANEMLDDMLWNDDSLAEQFEEYLNPTPVKQKIKAPKSPKLPSNKMLNQRAFR